MTKVTQIQHFGLVTLFIANLKQFNTTKLCPRDLSLFPVSDQRIQFKGDFRDRNGVKRDCQATKIHSSSEAQGQLVSQTKGVSWAKDVEHNSFAHENAITRLAACESPRIAIKHLI